MPCTIYFYLFISFVIYDEHKGAITNYNNGLNDLKHIITFFERRQITFLGLDVAKSTNFIFLDNRHNLRHILYGFFEFNVPKYIQLINIAR